MASNEWLVRKLHEQDKKIEALSRGGTGVGHTSIAPGENLTVISDNGEVVLGAGGVEHVDGPTPATPSAPTLKLGFGTIETTWDGSFAEGEDEDGVPLTAPVDFDVVEVHCSTDPEEEEWGEDTRRGQIKTREGGTVTVGGFDVDDEVFVCLIALAKTGKRSAPSATASLVIEGLDFAQLTNELDAATVTIDNAREVLLDGQNTLGEKLDAADTALSDLETTLDNLDSTTLPALRSDLDAAEGRLSEAEGQITDAFGEIAAIEPGAVNLANKSDLIRGTGPSRFLELDVWRFFEGNVGRKVTLSFDLVANVDNLQVRVYPYLNSGVSIETTTNVSASTSWQRFTVSTVVADYGTGSNRGSVGFYSELASGLIEMRNVKVEWGSKASAYSPSPADVGADISSAEQSAKSAAKSYADGLKTQIDSTIGTVRTELEGDITTAQAKADAAFQNAADADSKASTAKNTADQAKSDAAAAAGIANGKGKVVFGTTAPATADRLPTTLWIDTTSGANTPKRWSGTAWVAVTDKAAVDAANAAATAQSKANEAKTAADQAKATADAAQSAASAAQSTATQALTSANTKNKVTRSTSRPPAVYDGRVDDVWFTMSSMGGGGRVLFQEMWNGNTWVSVTIDSQVIAYLDAAKITTGYLDVAALIKAGAIAASQIAVGDFSNLASVDPIRGINVTRPAYWATKTVGDYATRGDSANNYLMFKDRTDTVPFTNGEALRMTFTAKATVPTDVGGALWAYPTDSNGPGSGSRSVTGDFVSVGTTEQNFTIKIDIPNNWADVVYRSWICGLFPRANTGGDMANVLVRDVRVYRMTGTTLIQNGSITTDKAAANLLEVGNLKAGTAAIAEAVVAKIAAQTASIQQADVKNLFVTGTSSLSDVVAERIAAETAEFIQLEVGNLVAGTGTMDTATINKLFADVVVASMAQAEQFIGENAILTGAVTAPKITASEELWAKIAQFVKIRAEHIEADAIDGMVITGATIRTAGGSGSWSDAGLRINAPDGTSLVRFPTNGEPLSLTASDTNIERASIGELDMSDSAVRSGGTMSLDAGVTPPTSPPELSASWELNTTLPRPPEPSMDWTGFAVWNGLYVRGVNVLGTSGDPFDRIEVYNLDGTLNKSISIDLNPRAGVAVIGDIVYTIGPDHNPNNRGKQWCHGFNLNTGARVSRWEFTRFDASNQKKIAIGSDGSNLLVAGVHMATVVLYVMRYNPSTGAQVGADMTAPFDAGSPTDIHGVEQSNGKIYVSPRGNVREYTISGSTLTKTAGFAWDNPNKNSGGFTFVGGVPVVVDSGAVHTGAAYASAFTIEAVYTWYNGTYETTPSPLAVIDIGPRETINVSLPKREGLQKRLYHRVQGGSTSWARTLVSEESTSVSITTGIGLFVPPSANQFPASAPAVLKAGNGGFEVKGDGSGHWGPLTFFANGSWSGAVVSGQVVITSPSANSTTSMEVTFPPGRFVNVPEVTTTVYSNSPRGVSVGVRDVSATSFTINMFSTSTGPRRIAWIAFDQGA